MTTINDQFQQYAEIQKQALEPMRAFSAVATEAFERMSRQNYQILGDWLDFAVKQAQLVSKATDANDYFTKQFETSRAFGETLVRRSQEYVEIATAVTAKTQAAVVKSTDQLAPRKAA